MTTTTTTTTSLVEWLVGKLTDSIDLRSSLIVHLSSFPQILLEQANYQSHGDLTWNIASLSLLTFMQLFTRVNGSALIPKLFEA